MTISNKLIQKGVEIFSENGEKITDFVQGTNVTIPADAFVVKVNLNATDIVGVQQSGSSLIILTQDGQSLTLEDFFIDGKKYKLAFDDGFQIYGANYEVGPAFSGLEFFTLESLADLFAAEATEVVQPSPWLWVVPLVGIAGIVAAASGSSSSSSGGGNGYHPEPDDQLAAAKLAAKKEVATLNLTKAQHDQINKAIDDATNKPAIDAVVSHARDLAAKNDADDLASAKKEAKDEVNKSNLDDKQKEEINKAIDDAKTQQEINNALNEAEKQSDINDANKVIDDAEDLASAKALAKEILKDLNLTDAQNTLFIKAIDNAINKDAIKSAIDNAIEFSALNDARDLAAAKTAAKNEVAKLNLDDAQKVQINKAIDNARNKPAIDKALDKAHELASLNDLQKQIDEAKDLATAKQIAKDKLKDLNLSDAQKAQITKAIDAATSKPAVVNELTKAMELSAANDAKDLEVAKAAAKQEIAKLNLNDAQKTQLNKAVDDAKTKKAVDDVLNHAKVLADINDVKQEIEKAQDLATAKEIAKDKLKDLDLSDAKKEEIAKAIDAAKDKDAVKNEIAKAIETAANETRDLNAAKEAAKDEVAKMNLDDSQKAQINKTIDAAKDQKAVNDALNEANKLADINDAKQAIEAAKDLTAAKQAAKDKLKDLNLSDAEKANYTKAIDNAKDKAGVTAEITKAIEASNVRDADDLVHYKEAAKDNLALLNLSDEQKAQISKAIDNAKNKQAVDAESNKAAELSSYNDQKQLAAAKDAALYTVNGLNLTKDQKAQIVDSINKATTLPALEEVLKLANQYDAINNAKDDIEKAKNLAEAKEVGKNAIGKLNLTPEQKEQFTKAINDANNKTAVADAVEKAIIAAEQNNAKDLEAAKQAAKDEVAKLNLSDSQKAKINKAIEDAVSKDSINKELAKAHDLSDKNDARDLESAKQAAKGEVSGLNLNNAQRDEINKAIDAAKNKEAVKTALDNAHHYDVINTATDDIAKAQELATAKEIVKEALGNLNLTDQQKNDLNKAINAATTKDAVKDILNQAGDLANVNNAKEALDDVNKAMDAYNKSPTDENLANLEKAIDKAADQIQHVKDADKRAELEKQLDPIQKLLPELNQAQKALDDVNAKLDAYNKDKSDENLKALQNAVENAKNAINKLPAGVDGIKDALGNNLQNIIDTNHIPSIPTFFEGILGAINDFIWNIVTAIPKGLFEVFKVIVDSLTNYHFILEVAPAFLTTATITIANIITEVINTPISFISNLAQWIMGFITGILGGIWGPLGTPLHIINGIVIIVDGIYNGIKAIIQTAGTALLTVPAILMGGLGWLITGAKLIVSLLPPIFGFKLVEFEDALSDLAASLVQNNALTLIIGDIFIGIMLIPKLGNEIIMVIGEWILGLITGFMQFIPGLIPIVSVTSDFTLALDGVLIAIHYGLTNVLNLFTDVVAVLLYVLPAGISTGTYAYKFVEAFMKGLFGFNVSHDDSSNSSSPFSFIGDIFNTIINIIKAPFDFIGKFFNGENPFAFITDIINNAIEMIKGLLTNPIKFIQDLFAKIMGGDDSPEVQTMLKVLKSSNFEITKDMIKSLEDSDSNHADGKEKTALEAAEDVIQSVLDKMDNAFVNLESVIAKEKAAAESGKDASETETAKTLVAENIEAQLEVPAPLSTLQHADDNSYLLTA